MTVGFFSRLHRVIIGIEVCMIRILVVVAAVCFEREMDGLMDETVYVVLFHSLDDFRYYLVMDTVYQCIHSVTWQIHCGIS